MQLGQLYGLPMLPLGVTRAIPPSVRVDPSYAVQDGAKWCQFVQVSHWFSRVMSCMIFLPLDMILVPINLACFHKLDCWFISVSRHTSQKHWMIKLFSAFQRYDGQLEVCLAASCYLIWHYPHSSPLIDVYDDLAAVFKSCHFWIFNSGINFSRVLCCIKLQHYYYILHFVHNM